MSENERRFQSVIVCDAGEVYEIEPANSSGEELPLGYKQTEVGTIPIDWGVTTIGNEFSVQLGKMVDAAKNRGEFKPYIGNHSVQWGRIDVESIVEVRMTPSDIRRYRLKNGDLLVCEGGEVGRSAIWRDQIPECYYQKALHRLRPLQDFDVYFLMSLLHTWATAGGLANYVTQTSIAHLPKERLERIPLPEPTGEEQRVIATALSDADALIESLDRLIARKRAIKQAAMQQLLTGETRLPGFEKAWESRRLESLGTFHKGYGIKRDDICDEGVACIRYGEIYTRYGDYTHELHSRIPRQVADSAFELRQGDLLFAGSGETAEEIGMCMAYLGQEEAYAGGDIVILRRKHGNAEYLGHLLNHSSVATQKMRLGQGDAVVHIGAGSLGQIEILLPPEAEQDAIARTLSDMDLEIGALKNRRDKARGIKQGMMQELLTGRTRLVEPNPEAAEETPA